ncbi:PIR Superfamily Protein [Plasmodium ovale wallikeri]|uniref:PIR protein n=2 Tax=Plasmodium ovale TaxID=36330 RepID=A0A1C3KKP2_PLAOA|nr:PIR Superfamily Protein [Plasmodium ovale wallikeri]SBT74542.1 PIR protein [Plasmodium ovale]
MTSKIVTGTYTFCINSNYYEAFVKCVKGMSGYVGKKDSCDNLSTSMTFSNGLNGKDICQEFKFLYKLLSDNSVGEPTVKDIFSDNDCNFLNYWLNGKLSDHVTYDAINVKEFYEKIKHKDADFFSKHCNQDNYFYNISPEIFENMKILYELYHTKQKILGIMLKEDSSDNGEMLCAQYTKECHEKYIEGMDKCLNDYDDFYKALKEFKHEYKYGIEEVTDESGHCSISDHFRLPEYDSVLERKQKKIMLIQNITTPITMLFIIPLLYKFTPFGSFLRGKIKMVKDKWVSQDKNAEELLSLSTYIEDNNSDIEEYNISYYSETNY